MKKKLILVAVIALAIAFAGYRYLYKGHRDISSEDADFEMASAQLLSEFKTDNAAANAKFADKTIVVSGKITDVEAEANSVMIDDKISVTFLKPEKALKVGESAKIKGRFVGYDDLLEELKMDQSTAIE